MLAVQIFVGGGRNYGLYAVVSAMPMAGFWVKYLKKKKHELLAAIGHTAMVLLLTVAHLHCLISGSAIL